MTPPSTQILPKLENESERINALKSYNILDTFYEEEFDRMTELASIICEVPISLISLIDETRQWFKSKVGLDATHTSREISFCQYAIMSESIFEVENASKDERFQNNPLVTGHPDIRFYAGCPLIDPNGFALGTLCVIDNKPKTLNETQQRALSILAKEIVLQIVARKEREDRKKEQEILAQKNKELFEITEAVDQSSLVSIADKKGIIIKVNQRFCELSQYSEEELLGQNHRIVNSGYHDKVFWRDMWKTISSGNVWRGEIKNKAKDGSEYWVSSVINPIFDNQGNITHYLSIRQDITDRKKSERELAVASISTELSSDAAYWMLHTAKIVRVNPAACNMLGYSVEELTSYSIPDLEPMFPMQQWESHWQYVKEHGFQHVETKHRRKDGTLIDVEVTANHITAGGQEYIFATARNITQRKQAEHDLHELTEELKVTNQELTASENELKSNIEQLHQIKNQLEESERHFRLLSENASDLIMLSDAKGNRLYASPSVKSFCGYEVDEFMKINGFDLIHPDDIKSLVEERKRVLDKEGASYLQQFRIKRKDGGYMWIESNSKVLKDGTTQTVSRDISARKQAEQLVRESEQTIRLLTENIPGLFWVRDVDGSILYASSSWKKLLGEQPTVGSSISILYKSIHPDDLPVIRKVSQESAMHGFDREVRMTDVDGVERWFHLYAFPIKDNTGAIYRVVGFGQDITQRRQAEDALRESEHTLKRAQEIGKVGSWTLEAEKNYVQWSEESYRIFGIPVGTPVTYDDFLTVIHPQDRGSVMMTWAEATQGASFDINYRIVVNGNVKWVTASAELEFDEKKNFVKAVGIVKDITESKAYESKLQEAKEQAENANRYKTEFLANMSHEIRTPLNSILGFSEILLQTANDTQSKNYLNIVLSSGRTLLSLINDLLDMVKIDAGKLELQAEAVDPRITVQEIKQMFSAQVTKKKIDFSSEFSADFPKQIVVDDVRLKQILVNLVGNAIKFTEKGFVKIKAGFVRNKPEDATGNLTLSVEDTGIGIHEKDLEAIFESFNQGTEQSVRHFGGTGLGLSITKRLTNLMNGELTVKSRVREGSEFTITLLNIPCISVEKTSTGNTTEKILFKKSTILVVDDVATNRELVEAYLGDHEVEIIMAQNGLEAIAKAEAHKPDLILMDLRMPVMDGREAAKIISQTDSLKYIPIIAFTASLTTNETIGVPFKGLLNKPVQRKPLFDELKKYLPHELITDSYVKKILTTNPHESQKDDLPKQLPELQSRFLQHAIELTKTMDVSEMELFLNNLTEYTLQNNLAALSSLLDKLTESYHQFDLDGVNAHLTEFIEMITNPQK